MRKKLAALMLTGAIALAPMQPAYALFGVGDVVIDPTNLAQNILTAARTLEMINNQITQLQNEAQMLINQGRNLTNLPHSSLARLQSIMRQTEDLLGEAQRVRYVVSEIERVFSEQYGDAAATGDFAAMNAIAEARWRTSVAGYEDALKVQAGVVGNIEATRTELSTLVSQSQGAVGALQAAQAGNQLLALQSQQMTDLTAAIAAQNRADALDAARRASAEAQGRENLSRFLDYGTGYTPTAVSMFR